MDSNYKSMKNQRCAKEGDLHGKCSEAWDNKKQLQTDPLCFHAFFADNWLCPLSSQRQESLTLATKHDLRWFRIITVTPTQPQDLLPHGY